MTTRPWMALAAALAACGSERPATPASPAEASSIGPGSGGWEPSTCTPAAGPLPDPCLALAREYAVAMVPAVGCVPGDTCGTLRPAVDVVADGMVSTVDGLCSCPVLVNDSRTAALDAALTRFLAASCGIGCCPCPSSAPAAQACPGPGTPHPDFCG